MAHERSGRSLANRYSHRAVLHRRPAVQLGAPGNAEGHLPLLDGRTTIQVQDPAGPEHRSCIWRHRLRPAHRTRAPGCPPTRELTCRGGLYNCELIDAAELGHLVVGQLTSALHIVQGTFD